jgi:hypothetical protein
MHSAPQCPRAQDAEKGGRSERGGCAAAEAQSNAAEPVRARQRVQHGGARVAAIWRIALQRARAHATWSCRVQHVARRCNTLAHLLPLLYDDRLHVLQRGMLESARSARAAVLRSQCRACSSRPAALMRRSRVRLCVCVCMFVCGCESERASASVRACKCECVHACRRRAGLERGGYSFIG